MNKTAALLGGLAAILAVGSLVAYNLREPSGPLTQADANRMLSNAGFEEVRLQGPAAECDKPRNARFVARQANNQGVWFLGHICGSEVKLDDFKIE